MDGVVLGLAELLLRISLGLCPQEIPRSSPASPWKTSSSPPLLLGLTHSQLLNNVILKFNFQALLNQLGHIFPYCPAVGPIRRIALPILISQEGQSYN